MRNRRQTIVRRQFLRGVGGFSLGLPFLPSLEPRSASGAEPAPEKRRYFCAITTNHGGIDESAMFPDVPVQDENLYAGFDIRRGSLVRNVDGDTASVSDIISAPATELREEIVARMNVLRGLDVPFYISHNTGLHLGNYAANNGDEVSDHMPTVDQLMAWSPSFYPDGAAPKIRSIHTGGMDRAISFNWSSPSTREGGVQEITAINDPSELFAQVFVPTEGVEEMASRPPIVDRVIETYRSLRQSNARLSAADRQRLDDHLDRLAELQRRLSASAKPGAACGTIQELANGHDVVTRHRNYVDVVVTAFTCGTSRIAVIGVIEEEFPNYSGDWHEEVAHQHTREEPQLLLRSANRDTFRHVMLDLANKLDVEDEPGVSLLDNALIQWSQESGPMTHEARCIPVVTIGGAAETLKTGQYCDYRSLDPSSNVGAESEGYLPSGLPYSQWLATALQTMSLGADQWQSIEHNGDAGYGHPQRDLAYAEAHVAGVMSGASDWLPFLKA